MTLDRDDIELFASEPATAAVQAADSGSSSRPHRGSPRHRLSQIGWELLLPILLVAAWWIWSVQADSLFYPPVPAILRSFSDTWFGSGFLSDVIPSLSNLAIGYVVGVVLGIAVGTGLALLPWLRTAATPVLEFARSLPAPAVLPFAILVLGIGDEMKIGIIILGVIFPVLINTVDGIRSIEPTTKEMARVYRLPLGFRLRYVVLPAASPQIVVGARTSLSIGILLMVVSEMVASTHGIGFFTIQAQRSFAFPQMWSGMLLLGILGYLLNALFGVGERRVLRWQASAARAAAGR